MEYVAGTYRRTSKRVLHRLAPYAVTTWSFHIVRCILPPFSESIGSLHGPYALIGAIAAVLLLFVLRTQGAEHVEQHAKQTCPSLPFEAPIHPHARLFGINHASSTAPFPAARGSCPMPPMGTSTGANHPRACSFHALCNRSTSPAYGRRNRPSSQPAFSAASSRRANMHTWAH